MESQVDARRRTQRRHARLALAALITLLALLQRVSAAATLPVDADESVYAWAASTYAGLMARGEWRAIPGYTYNSEHPAFAKLLYAVGLRLTGHAGIPKQDDGPPPYGSQSSLHLSGCSYCQSPCATVPSPTVAFGRSALTFAAMPSINACRLTSRSAEVT